MDRVLNLDLKQVEIDAPEIRVVDEPSNPHTGEFIIDLRPLVSRL